ncbi:MAG: hypothetical protein KKF46_03470 [Nanoarchaeota archaeon]|nr:hypothetical protein [Nanoarchaeota archaeon]MBU1321394.1 hypothetical protein [Nanoarchaeota archaeon]MBU1597454.1 hypothetical protein [Nanoarchaeota archaeon]MBU2441361.1 hypothetical protein [Nanoarchaeota archaeon]
MEVRADKFLTGHYAYFSELPDRTHRLEGIVSKNITGDYQIKNTTKY